MPLFISLLTLSSTSSPFDKVQQLPTPPSGSRPSPRAVSNAFAEVEDSYWEPYPSDGGVNALFLFWGQLVAYDMTATRTAPLPLSSVSYPQCDSFFDPFCEGSGSFPIPSLQKVEGEDGEKEPVSDVTPFMDGSWLYGDSEGFSRELREGRGGRLKEERGLPPFEVSFSSQDFSDFAKNKSRSPSLLDPSFSSLQEEGLSPPLCPFFQGRDRRVSRSIGASGLLSLFVKLHNQIADNLQGEWGEAWNDQQTFEEAKKRVVGVIQKITYEEFLPRLLGKKEMFWGMVFLLFEKL